MAISDEWWNAWWDADYSWEGLAKKPWEGWYVDKAWVEGQRFEPVSEDERIEGVDYREATLQDYWRRAGCADHLVQMPDSETRFTLMHLPPQWRDGTPTAKIDPENVPAGLEELLKAELGREIKDTVFEDGWRLKGADHRMQWQGVVLPTFRLSDLSPQTRDKHDRIPVTIIAGQAAFSGNANFRSAAFSGDAYFESAAFSGDASFSSAAFSGNAYFESAAFSGYANFMSAAFSGDADFESAAFSGDAYFSSAAFSGDAYFMSAAFSGNADFISAAFSGNANFISAAFSGNANFRSAAFSGNANFISAAFLSDAVFSGKGNSVTSDAVRADIKPNLGVEGALTYTQAEAISWTAQRSFPNASFLGATFMGAARFDNRDFHSAARFDDARFFRKSEFHGGALHRGILFTQTEFDLALTPKARVWTAAPKEALERLHKAAMLSVPEDEQQSLEAWAQTRFAEIAEKDAALKPETDPARSRYFERVEEGFRTLKHAMEDRRNRGQEARFFKLELRARRERRDEKFVPKWERLLSDGYRWTSDFGTSFFQPLFVLFIILIPTFAISYWLMVNWVAYVPDANSFGDALAFSFGRVLPFGPWAEPDACSVLGQMLDPLNSAEVKACAQVDGFTERAFRGGTPIVVRFVASLQSVMALVLVFLSGLAIRRRFQIN